MSNLTVYQAIKKLSKCDRDSVLNRTARLTVEFPELLDDFVQMFKDQYYQKDTETRRILNKLYSRDVIETILNY